MAEASQSHGVYASIQLHHVFIMCDQSDDEWAEKCRAMLTHPPQKLNVVTRKQDFIPGRTVNANYKYFMANSSKLLLVLTPEFLTNVWKPYLEDVMENHLDKVIPVMLRQCQEPDLLKDQVCITVTAEEFLLSKQLFAALQEQIAGQESRIYDHLQRPLTYQPQFDPLVIKPPTHPPEPPPRQRNSTSVSASHDTGYIDVLSKKESINDAVHEQAPPRHSEDNEEYEEVYPRLLPGRINTDYIDMNRNAAGYDIPANETQPTRNDECEYEEIGDGKTLKEMMLTKMVFFHDPKKFISQFNSTTGRMQTKAETFIINKLLDFSSDPSSALRGDLELLTQLANCNSSWVVRKALDNLLSEIFLSIGDIQRGRNVLEAEVVLRNSIETVLVEEHRVAKTQRITTYGWLVTLVLLRWSDLKCSIPQLDGIKKFDKTLERLQNDNKERNLFRYGLSMAREAIRRMTSKSQDLKDIAKRHLRICENILNSRMEDSEITKLGESIDDNSWLDLHICLVFLQELPQLHKFKDDVKPVTLMQKLITNNRVRFRQYNKLSKRMKHLPSGECDWRVELLVYRVLLKLLRPPTCTAIINQVVYGSPGCDGIKSYWTKGYGLNNSQFAMEYLRKLCRKAIFVPEPQARLDLVNLTVDDQEVFIPEELSIGHLHSMYRQQGLSISSSNSRNAVRQNVTTRDVVLRGEKGVLEIFKHSRNQLLPSDFPHEFSWLRDEIEILRILNEASEKCPNIIRLLGCGVDLPAHIILERPTKGDLLTYLQKNKITISNAAKLRAIALDVCKAMIFLGEFGIVHRDLRAANVFVLDNEQGEIISKLGDFRFSKSSRNEPGSPTLASRKSIIVSSDEPDYSQLAVRWMAVESLRIGEFSYRSDVWSFGVLLFEIFTLGCTPYLNMPNGLSLTDNEVKDFILDGYRLELYQSIPLQIKLIIESTWIENMNERPAFVDLKSRLEETEFQQEKCDLPSTYGTIRKSNSDIMCPTRLSKTICPVNNCSGDCLNVTDAPVCFQVDDVRYTKEMVSLDLSSHIQRLANLRHPALAVIEQINTHIESLELVTEVGDMGNLSQFIKKYGCSWENAMIFLTKIAEAITFLHSRRFIHCDIRAEAVYIYSNRDTKLARLARARSLKSGPYGESQRASTQIKMPEDSMRWSAPEVIKGGTYSEGSDVWAFGVLMWELFTLKDVDTIENKAEISPVPYNNHPSNKQILAYLEMGNRLYKPDSCPNWLYIVMTQCWLSERLERPSMAAILDCLTHRRPFQSWLLKQWLRRQRNHIYENWPDINVEQDEKLDHVLPTQCHSTDDDLCSLSNEEFIGESEYMEMEEIQPPSRRSSSRKPVPVPRKQYLERNSASAWLHFA